MNLRRVGAIVLRQYYLLRGSPTRLAPLVTWFAVDIILYGFLARYLGEVAPHGPNFTLTLVGAVLLWDFFTRIMQGVTTAFLEDVWARNLLNLFATPVRVSEYVAGLVLTGIATSLIGLFLMLVFASFAFGFPVLTYGPGFVSYVGVLVLFGVALGIVASALMLRLGPASEWLIWPLPALLSPFAGVFYPLSVLPEWMRAIARVLPPSYVFEGLRARIAGAPFDGHAVAWGAGLALVHLAIACFVFARVFRGVLRSGLLARYSAESVA